MTIQRNYLKNGYSIFILVISIFLSPLTFHRIDCLRAQSLDGSEDNVRISFEDKLAFYLDQKSKKFLFDMANKEKMLLQMVRNISKEVKVRGNRIVLENEIGYEDIFGEADKLISEYSEELDNIIQILDEIKLLEKVVEQTSDLNSWEKLSDLRYQLVSMLESRELFKKGIHTQDLVSDMFKDYYGEIDSVVSMYKRLNILERQAKARGDLRMLKEIDLQKNQISLLLGQLKSSLSDTLANQYIAEVIRIIDIARELDNLETKAIYSNSEYSFEIEEVRRSILQNVDSRLLKLLGYDAYFTPEGPTVSEIFKEWKVSQIANFNVRFTQYKIMKKRLLESASIEERTRMLEWDLKDAFSNYIDENFELAELQFNTILEDYGDYFNTLESVLFYRAESYYGRGLYEEAAEEYEKILDQFPDSPYFGDSLARLLLINERLNNKTNFYKYFNIVNANGKNLDNSHYDQCNYLAGYVYFKDSRFDLARSTLASVSKDSKFYLKARYLLGIVYSNLKEYDGAIEIFKDLASLENYPWTDPQTTFVRNNALLKLGYLYYERGEYEEALGYFNSVSPGFNQYDKSLLGAAWTNLKVGNYTQTVEKVDLLFQDYLASDYTYEALVLSAHCKRLLNQKESALRDLRYVANARSVLELSNQYNAERKLILEQLDEIDQLEREVLERRDKALYRVTSQIRDHIQNMLLQFRHRGETGSLVLEELQDERKAIFKQIEKLDEAIVQAYEQGEKDIVNDAYFQRERLIKALDTYQADRSIRNINYFLDYPLATKEGSINYRKTILSKLAQEIENERKKIQVNLAEAKKLQKKQNGSKSDLGAKLDLEVLEQDLKNLKKRIGQFRSWLANNEISEINTDFDQWADFSGFGMSDIAFKSIEDRDKRIAELAFNVNSINNILQNRRKTLEDKLNEFDEEVKKIEEELKQEQLQIEKKEKEKYFREFYFDESEREEENEREERSDKPTETSRLK